MITMRYLPRVKEHPLRGGLWIVTFPFSEEVKETIKQAGFRWNPRGCGGHPATEGRWWTNRVEVAAKLFEYGDDNCKRAIDQMLRADAGNQIKLRLGIDKQKNRVWRVECPAQFANIPKAAGFKWNRSGCYAARPSWCALLLKDYADDAARAELLEYDAALSIREQMSRATDARADLPIPAELRDKGWDYLPYQRAGIAFAMDKDAVLIADEMGLGKTIQAIGVLNCMPEARKVLIVCPASLKLNWKRELHAWLVDKFLHIGIAESRAWPRPVDTMDEVMLRGGRQYYGQIVIINYDILDKPKPQHHIHAEDWDLVIADECHYVKNPETNRAKAMFGIKAKRKVFLTGTPIANRARELKSILHYLDPQNWGNEHAYMRLFCGADGQGGSNLDYLQRLLRGTLMVRRLKADVLKDLPAKRRQIIELPADAAVHRANETAMLEFKAVLDQMREKVLSTALTEGSAEFADQAGELRRGSFGDASVISRIRHETALSKVPVAIEFLKDALVSSKKIVVFAHHKDVIAQVAAAFGNKAVTLTGDMSMEARQQSVDRFQKDADCQLFIGSIMAAGVGLTLTAASHVVFIEEDWVPGNMSQAEDRCHRIGQQDSVLVQHLVLEGSLDAYMVHTIIRKQELIEQALDRREVAA